MRDAIFSSRGSHLYNQATKVRTMRLIEYLCCLPVLLFTLSSCAESVSVPEEGFPTQVTVKSGYQSIYVQTRNAGRSYLHARVSKYAGNGRHKGAAVTVELVGPARSGGSDVLYLAPNNYDLIDQVVNGFGPQLPESIAFEAGKMVAAQSVCAGQKITRNTYGRRYSNPAVLSQIGTPGASPLGATVPVGAEGNSLPRAEYSLSRWEVNLWCS